MSTTAFVGTILPATAIIGYRFCKIYTPDFNGTAFDQAPSRLFDQVAYRIETGTGVTAGAIIPYVLGADGTWRKSTIAALTLTASANFEGLITSTTGPILGAALQFSVALLVGNVTYAHVIGLLKSNVAAGAFTTDFAGRI